MFVQFFIDFKKLKLVHIKILCNVYFCSPHNLYNYDLYKSYKLYKSCKLYNLCKLQRRPKIKYKILEQVKCLDNFIQLSSLQDIPTQKQKFPMFFSFLFLLLFSFFLVFFFSTFFFLFSLSFFFLLFFLSFFLFLFLPYSFFIFAKVLLIKQQLQIHFILQKQFTLVI